MLHGFASHYEIQQVALIQVNRGMPNESIKGKHDFHGITHHCDGQQEIAHAKIDEDMQNESIKANCKGMYGLTMGSQVQATQAILWFCKKPCSLHMIMNE
jgi:hypothetical protein